MKTFFSVSFFYTIFTAFSISGLMSTLVHAAGENHPGNHPNIRGSHPSRSTIESSSFRAVELQDLSLLSRSYYQVSTNRYVKTTSEIDWGCVNVTLSMTPETGGGFLHKQGHLHHLAMIPDNKYLKLTNCQKTHDYVACPTNETVILPTEKTHLYQFMLILQEQDDVLVMITKSDNFTAFTWSTSLDLFQKHAEEVDRIWKSRLYNDWYKEPIPSYDLADC